MKRFLFLVLFLPTMLCAYINQPKKVRIISSAGQVHVIELENMELSQLYITSCRVDYMTASSEAIFQTVPDDAPRIKFDGVTMSLHRVLSDFYGFACDFRIEGKHHFIFKLGEFKLTLTMQLAPFNPTTRVEMFSASIQDQQFAGVIVQSY